jgi:hypothetical protein
MLRIPKLVGLLPFVSALALSSVCGNSVAFGQTASHEQLDRSLDKATERGSFRVSLRSLSDPIPMNRIHSWAIRLSDRNGQALSGATIRFAGGMPAHRHGFPTEPRIIAGRAPGEYLLQGLRFSMPGWWEIRLAVEAGGRVDGVVFNVVL